MVAAKHEGAAPADPARVIDSLALVGTAPQVVARLEALAAAGVQEIVIWPFPAQGQDMDDFMHRLAQDVLPHVAEGENPA
jgi:alkanesulfonate monooxygenase SsuD/methylene tetrahydromethanopterin reductase-like flavin-dependent oxidoreductase (luciferase family)